MEHDFEPDDGRIFKHVSRLSGDCRMGSPYSTKSNGPSARRRGWRTDSGFTARTDDTSASRLSDITSISSMPASIHDGDDDGGLGDGVEHGDYPSSEHWQFASPKARPLQRTRVQRRWPIQQRRRLGMPCGLEGFETPTSTDARSARSSMIASPMDGFSDDELAELRSPVFGGGHANQFPMRRRGYTASPTHSRTNSHVGSERSTASRPLLLHITVLPETTQTYLAKVLEAANAPREIQELHELLQSKLDPMVMSRGVLITHPGDDYGLLEERLLESLELRIPRISSCGHFLGGELPEFDSAQECSRRSSSSQSTCVSNGGRRTASACSIAGSLSQPTCAECKLSIHLPLSLGDTQASSWEIKVYAANGLMRAGAWSAAWQEMERVDVEIRVQIPVELRRRIEALQQIEDEALQGKLCEAEESKREAEIAQEKARAAAEQMLHEAREEIKKSKMRVEQLQAEKELGQRDKVASVEHSQHTCGGEPSSQALCRSHRRPSSSRCALSSISQTSDIAPAEIPLSQIISNYLYLLAQDRRNIAIGLASLLLMLSALSGLSYDTTVASQFTTDSGNRSVVETRVPTFVLPTTMSLETSHRITQLDLGAYHGSTAISAIDVAKELKNLRKTTSSVDLMSKLPTTQTPLPHVATSRPAKDQKWAGWWR